MIRSRASRCASAAAASAVASSGYPIAIRSAIVLSFLGTCLTTTTPARTAVRPTHDGLNLALYRRPRDCYYAPLGKVLERDEPDGSERSPHQRSGSVHSSAYAAIALDAPLESKLHAPEPRDGWVDRPALVGRLARARARLVLVDAPAGYGKTTLIAQWRGSAGEDRPFAWVSLDPDDNDPVSLWSHVAHALHRARPELCAQPLLEA